MVNIKQLFRSFKNAFRGLFSVIKKEQNFRLHSIAAIAVIFLSVYFQIKIWQWCLIILMITAVFILEMLNTIIERLVDMLQPRVHQYVKEIKDIMSAVVLITALASVAIALLIFGPIIWLN